MSPKNTIIRGDVPPAAKAPSLRPEDIPAEKQFSFSLQYWRQPENFGLGEVTSSWYTSLLNRLCELSREKISDLLGDQKVMGALRFHKVDWDHRNCPIDRKDLFWLPRTVLENDTDYPILQFHVSKAMGRVHGFLDLQYRFNIVLLDPFHNMYPDKDVGYRLRSTTEASCEYSALQAAVDAVCGVACSGANCNLANAVVNLRRDVLDDAQVILAGISVEKSEALKKLRASFPTSIADLLVYAIETFQPPTPPPAPQQI